MHSTRERTTIDGDWRSPVDKHVELFSELFRSRHLLSLGRNDDDGGLCDPSFFCRRIPRSFHCIYRAQIHELVYVRAFVVNERIASQGMSILNRKEGSTENNEIRYDEREVVF